MHLIQGGLPAAGEIVLVNGRKATVIQAAFSTFVFGGDVSVRFENGQIDLVPLEWIEREGKSL